VPYVVFALLLLAELAAILFLNHGSLVYSLDDAYIHLALAGRIWTGTYGINAHEFAAPASSILWPFLLAPFSVLPTPVFTAVPFVINVIAASTSLVLIVREVGRSLGLYTPGSASTPSAASTPDAAPNPGLISIPDAASTPISAAMSRGGSSDTAAKLSARTPGETSAGLATGMSPPMATAFPPSHAASASSATSSSRAQSAATLAAMLFASGLVLATNLVPIIFTGMEHSLQQMLAVMIVVGLIEEARTGRASRMLWIALLVLPLVRYDSLALAVPALLYLAWRRHWRGFASVAAIIAVVCGGFSLFLMAHGLGIMPASVMAKSEVLRSGGSSGSHFAMLTALVANVYGNLVANPQGNVMLGGLALVLAPALDRRRPLQERAFALVPATALALEFVVGKFGAYFRYEAYVWTATLVALIHLYRDPLKRILSSEGSLAPQVGLLGGLAAASVSYLYTLATTPIASNNIYDQQYQMHRFVSEYYQAPVAVNDLGWVAFRNSNYVLDLAGLASKEALTARLHESGPTWMERLCREHDVRFAMIYDGWFPDRPAEWVRVGTLKFAQLRVTAASAAVQFYATDPAEVPTLRAALLAFQTSLPRGVSFHFEPTAQEGLSSR
jgi:hypothetical protein